MGVGHHPLIGPWFAMKGQENNAPTVKRRQKRNKRPHAVTQIGQRALRRKQGFQNNVFGIIPSKRKDPRQRQGSHQHHAVRPRNDCSQAPHHAHILFMGQGMDHRAGAQKQQRLKKRMGKQMEHGRGIGPHAHRHHHVPQLAAGGIGNHAFNIKLRHPHRGGKQRRGHAQYQNHLLGQRRQL